MMQNIDRLIARIDELNNPTVVGLDPTLEMIPPDLKEAAFKQYGDSLKAVSEMFVRFNKAIIDSVADIVPAVKPQIAMYEKYGIEGLSAYVQTTAYAAAKGLYVIGDIKRGDIASTAAAYAAHLSGAEIGGAHVDCWHEDAVTVNPYLGSDGVDPFVKACETTGKAIFILVKTSNPSSGELQDLHVAPACADSVAHDAVANGADRAVAHDAVANGADRAVAHDAVSNGADRAVAHDAVANGADRAVAHDAVANSAIGVAAPGNVPAHESSGGAVTVYEQVASLTARWGEHLLGDFGYSAVGAVVGATHPSVGAALRKKLPHTFFLVPGYGAQGASAGDLADFFDERGGGCIVNSSRGIIAAWKNTAGRQAGADIAEPGKQAGVDAAESGRQAGADAAESGRQAGADAAESDKQVKTNAAEAAEARVAAAAREAAIHMRDDLRAALKRRVYYELT